ncbi:Ig-like domain-containing protein [Candidatus Palauibacter sp.]|uniref:Ig-like domain-containing protein n=1 Tax=Candidatus Palauibacter sp. TaxID=3101350 RepID=UPI003B5CC479
MAAAVAVAPASVSFTSLGDTVHLTASVTDQYGQGFNATVTWESEAPTVVTVDAGGVATSTGNGSGTVRATVGEVSGTAGVTVRQEAAELTIEPSSITFSSLGDTAVAVVSATDANGHPVPDPAVIWESSAPHVVAVDSAGVVTAVAPGSALITATSGAAGFSVTATVEIETGISVTVLDTTLVLPVAAGGLQWTLETEETRWLPELPVAAVERRDSPPGLLVRVLGPGWVRARVDLAGGGSIATTVAVEPPDPFVLELRQDDWPRSDAVTARGYAVDRIPLPAFHVSGAGALQAEGDSVEMVFRLPPLNEGRCAGNPLSAGTVVVQGIDVRANPAVNRLAGPVAALEVGESYRLSGREACLRLVAPPTAQYVLAGMERSTIDDTRLRPLEWRYGGGGPYEIEVIDRTSEPARDRVAEPDVEPDEPFFALPRMQSADFAAATDHGIDDATTPWKVGDRIERSAIDGRSGTFEVVGVYPPNLVLAIFEPDREIIWAPRKAREMNEVMERLASDRIQNVYRTIYGPSSRPPASNTINNQLVIMYSRGNNNTPGGRTSHNVMNDDRRTTLIHIADYSWSLQAFFHELVAHELAHAWQFANLPGFVGVWSSEGIAHFVADEVKRAASGTPLDANLAPNRYWLGLDLNVPDTGDFLWGYHESADYLRFLVNQLIFGRGMAYESAAHDVVAGFAEGYWGHYYTHFGSWRRTETGRGLVDRMRAEIPGWDPVDSRLDWMVSYAIDDRVRLANYDIPFVRNAWAAFPPRRTFTLGRGQTGGGTAALGGQFYFRIEHANQPAGSLQLRVTAGDAEMEWKVVRYR